MAYGDVALPAAHGYRIAHHLAILRRPTRSLLLEVRVACFNVYGYSSVSKRTVALPGAPNLDLGGNIAICSFVMPLSSLAEWLSESGYRPCTTTPHACFLKQE